LHLSYISIISFVLREFTIDQCLKWTVAQSPNAANILFGQPKAAPNWVVAGPTKNVWAIA
jgi:hypothetical protein